MVERLYLRHGHRIGGPPGDELWHFSFGSNMNAKVLVGRGVRPREWRAGKLDGYRLRFNLDGRPAGKTAPANITPDPAETVWGVLYRLTWADMVRIDRTEGVPHRGRYRHHWVEIEDAGGARISAVTYMADGKEHDGAPSLRYITLLRDGARAHGLPEDYVRRLDAVRHAR